MFCMRHAWACLSLAALGCASGATIHSDFEGGSLGAVRRTGDASFVCATEGQADHEGRNRQVTWYYFRVDGARGRDVTVTLNDLVGEYDYRPGALGITERTVPLYSHDRERWTHFDAVSFDKEKKELTLRFTPREDPTWVAHVEPYTWSRFGRFLGGIRENPLLRLETLGKTVQGRDLYLFTITNPAVPDGRKKVVWAMFRQHAWESGTSFVGEGVVRYMLSDDARDLRDKVVFKVFPLMDPDGCAEGGVRFNRNGYDVNRNWDSVDVSKEEHRRLMPEIWHAKKALHGWLDGGRPIHLFLTLHNEEYNEWLSGSEEFGETAERFYKVLKETTTFHPGDPGPRAPRARSAPGRMSVYEYLQRERHVPAFIIEQRIVFNDRLGRLPTSKDRLEFGRGLARALCLTALR